MAEGFEPYHVPQQSRRDKLRVLLDDNNSLQNCQVPLYDPSIVLPSDLSIFQEINGNPFLYTPQIPRFLDQSFHRTEPLSSSVTIAHNSNTNGQGNLSLSLSSLHHTSSFNNDLSSKSTTTVTTSCVPLGPFTGYSIILKRSRFLKPAQNLLEELCDLGKGINYADDDDSNLIMDPPQAYSNGDEQYGKKKSRLISMLDEVYQKYKEYHQQLQMVVASFESVAGLGNAAPFANIALKTMSKHFKCLKDAITDQLQFTSKSSHNGHLNCERHSDPIPSVGIPGKELYCQRPETQPVWRPQRGLPERAVTVLRAWLFDHFLHPYPTDTDKVMLAKQTGLSRNQVSNWFINARVRLWKPMVEEIHMLETRESHNKSSQREGQNNNDNTPIEHFPTTNSYACESSTPSTSTPRLQGIPSKRSRSDLANIPNNIGRAADSINLSYGNLSSTGAGGGVSLTLGLHQNSGNIGLSEPFPMNAARRFGIENNTNSGRFMFGGFEEHNVQFGRNNTMVGGQFLHEFAG
ncbi:BEL1-like homeodomain protein 9 [Lycium barbarum]|uniref:BEL1-like homeodomain protein 9 n=1 Tax=Lycium barbarum TaxID=112863 RepID=UPI00293E08C5|nr:BEL1-like homeodomain protein 9 [Lycium barbarum]